MFNADEAAEIIRSITEDQYRKIFAEWIKVDDQYYPIYRAREEGPARDACFDGWEKSKVRAVLIALGNG